MNQNYLQRIKNELINKNQIYVPDEWLEEISIEQQENINGNLSYDYFYNRWLNTNLLEINYSSLDQIPNPLVEHWNPSNQFNMKCKFQILIVQDVGKPQPNDFCENLYKKAKDYEDEENEQQNNQPNNQRFVTSKHRQLAFQLFNGKQLFKAFEYEPITQLNFSNCYPGAKLSIEGNFIYSNNVMLLKSSNVVPLGGLRLQLIEENQPNINLLDINQININHPIVNRPNRRIN